MRAEQIMSNVVNAIDANMTVAEVARLLLKSHDQGLPVVDQNGKLLGLVTESDVVTKHAHPHVPVYLGILGFVVPIERRVDDEEVRRVLAVTARDLMTRDVPTVDPETDVDDVASLMVEHDINPVPVVAGGRIVGMVSHRDIIRLLLSEEEDGSEGATPE